MQEVFCIFENVVLSPDWFKKKCKYSVIGASQIILNWKYVDFVLLVRQSSGWGLRTCDGHFSLFYYIFFHFRSLWVFGVSHQHRTRPVNVQPVGDTVSFGEVSKLMTTHIISFTSMCDQRKRLYSPFPALVLLVVKAVKIYFRMRKYLQSNKSLSRQSRQRRLQHSANHGSRL